MSNGIVIFVEGETEEVLYKRLLEYVRLQCADGRFSQAKVIVKNLKGIGNYKTKACRIFTKDITPKHEGMSFTIFLCYDTDVFEFSINPPVDWREIDKALVSYGAQKVVHIKAKGSIENWFLYDLQGVCRFLKIQIPSEIKGKNGVEKVQNLFKKADKIYIKGGKAEGLVTALNINKIMAQECKAIRLLCKALGANCEENTRFHQDKKG